MSCGCKTSGDSAHSCGSKSASGCESVDTCGNSYKLSVFDWLSDVKQPSQNQYDYVEVRFKNDRKSFYHNANKLPISIGSIITVESSPGQDIGVVSLVGELVRIQMKKKRSSEKEALKIYRIANEKDVETWKLLREKEEQIKIESRKISRRLGLEMKITDIEYQGDGAKITFYYTAEGRVDFRQLIKEFAMRFKTKIDMKQIGFRQEAAKVGGIGSCGRELCCSTWLTDFRSVNTQAARYQQLSINPQKLAGQCGKLKCCLNYELDSYVDTLNQFPSSSTVLDTQNGRAFCIKIDVFKKKMWFAYTDNSMSWYDLDIRDVKDMIAANKKGEKCIALEDLNPIENVMVTSDLIQENRVDRFEKKRSPRQKQESSNSSNGQQQRKQRPRKPKQSGANTETRENRNTEQRTQNSSAPNAKKPKKKTPRPDANK